MGVALVVLLAVVVAVALWAARVYNRMVIYRNEIANAFGQIDVQLKRRYDLIPNLVETAKKYMSHEAQTLEAVINARTRARVASEQLSQGVPNAQAMREVEKAEKGLVSSLGNLFALRESYPDLKADRTMHQLSEELKSTENRVSFARQAYNDSILAFNNAAQVFPDNLIAGALGFKELPMLQSIEAPEERHAPKVVF